MPGLPTGVSGSNAAFDVLDIIQEAAERAGIDFTSGQTLRTARVSLDLLSTEWANEGLNLWTVDSQTIQFMPLIATYQLPADTIDIIYPILKAPYGSGTIDFPIARIDVTEYGAIPNKTYQGRPTQVYINRQESPTITVWPVPPDPPLYSLVYYRLRRMSDSGSATNSMDVPFRFVSAMTAGLAYKLAQKSRDPMVLQRLPMLKQDYQEAFDKAKYEDRDRSSIRLVPFQY